MKKNLYVLLLCFVACVKCLRNPFRFVHNPTTNEECSALCRRPTFRAGESIGQNITDNDLKALILTPYIEQDRLLEAVNLSSVNPKTFFGYESFSGFLTVDKDKSSHLFFWFFPATNGVAVADAPWILWLQGGPGSSSMDGLFNEFGPFRIGSDGNLELNHQTWHRNHSLVFIDNPVGAGFSYTDDINGYSSHMHTYSEPLYSALKQLVKLFPELKMAPLFVAGESYAGKYVPALAMEIHKHKSEDNINLQGLLIGNGLLDRYILKDSLKIYRSFGLVEKEQYDKLDPIRVALIKDIDANNSFESSRKYNQLIFNYIQMAGLSNEFNFLANTTELGNYQTFINQANIRKALHVGNITFNQFNTTVYDKIISVDFLSSSKDNLETLLDNYRVLIYCGQLDLLVPCESTADLIREFKWKNTEEFLNAPRDPWIYDDKVAGYHKSGGGLTWIVVRGAGHFVPSDKPAEAQEMIALWTHSRPIPIEPGPSLQNLTELVAEYSVDQAEAENIEDPAVNETDDAPSDSQRQ